MPYSPLAGGVLSGKYNGDFHPKGRFTSYMKSPNTRQRAMATRFLNDKTLASTAKYLDIAKEALRLGAQKLPIKTKFVVRNDYVE